MAQGQSFEAGPFRQGKDVLYGKAWSRPSCDRARMIRLRAIGYDVFRRLRYLGKLREPQVAY